MRRLQNICILATHTITREMTTYSSNYLDLLRIIGTSSKPLRIVEIKGELETEKNRKISYSLIKTRIQKLHSCNFGDYIVPLFRWDQIPGNKLEERRFVNRLISVFGRYVEEELTAKLDFKKNLETSELIISKGGNKIIIIGLFDNLADNPSNGKDSKFDNSKMFYPYIQLCKNNLQFHLYEKEGELQFNASQLLDAQRRIQYNVNLCKESASLLSISYGAAYDETINEIDRKSEAERERLRKKGDIIVTAAPETRELNRLRDKLNSIARDESSHEFNLNIRGLVLYLIREKNKEKIESVVNNLSINYTDQFPFLTHFNQISLLFKQIGNQNKDFTISMLKKISKELYNQIDSSEGFLNYCFTKRYFNEISLSLLYAIHLGLLENKLPHLKLIQDFSLKMLSFIETYAKEEYEEIKSHIEYIEGDYIDGKELMRGYTFPLS